MLGFNGYSPAFFFDGWKYLSMIGENSTLSVSINQLLSPIGLVAGNGTFPLEFVKNAKSHGLDVVVVAHQGETDREIERQVKHCEWIKVGQLGKIFATFKRHGVRQVAFAGGIVREKLFGGVKLDLKALALLAKIRSVKDDAILRAVARELELGGMSVFAASVLLSESVVRAGSLTKRQLSEEEVSDALIGWEAAKTMGRLDIGQTVVVAQGLIVAVEAVEGTDATIRRAGQLVKGGGVVVKVLKPQQDQRIDLPTVGPNTIHILKEAKIDALVLEADRTIMLQPTEVVALANRAGIAIRAIHSPDELMEK